MVDVTQWTSAVQPTDIGMISDRWRDDLSHPLAKAALTDEEIELVERMVARAEKLLDLADQLNVQVMIDAEYGDQFWSEVTMCSKMEVECTRS
jgi:hypothetical protein